MRRIDQAVVLAGGEGTRLKPLTNTRPKPLLPILDRPCLEYVIESLSRAGISDIFLTCSYRSADVVAAIGNGERLGARIIYSFEEEPMGTAGAVKLLEEKLDETFVVASGDVLADVDIKSLIEFHERHEADVTIALTQVERPEEFGIVGLDDQGRILKFKEKPSPQEVFSNLINAGIYVLKKEVLAEIPFGEKFDFSRNLFPRLLAAERKLFGFRIPGFWKDIGRPFDLLEANIKMADRTQAHFRDGLVPSGDRFVKGSAKIVGSSYVGRDVALGEGCVISSSVIGKESMIGDGSEIVNSLVLGRCHISNNCVISESILGEGCVIGPGARIVRSVLGDGIEIKGPRSLEGATEE
ncbi:MAG: NDP-sugar synthase [Methanomassiliicoccales archaeon]|jgi:mannose-1-phosphate guanylyltransferase|nr:NDP-sugar synthase [Methanomassiliicoccales archaeon]